MKAPVKALLDYIIKKVKPCNTLGIPFLKFQTDDNSLQIPRLSSIILKTKYMFTCKAR